MLPLLSKWLVQWTLDAKRAKGLAKFVRYNEVLFCIFYYYWGNENRSLYGGLCYIEVRYIEVPL